MSHPDTPDRSPSTPPGDVASGEASVERAEGRFDTSRKSYRAILVEEISQCIAEYQRPTLGLLLSSLAAGLEIGFSVLLMAVMLTLVEGQFRFPVSELLAANMYAVGFILVILGRSELFTEHTTLAVLPVIARRLPLRGLACVWAVVYAGNLLGLPGVHRDAGVDRPGARDRRGGCFRADRS